MNPEQFDDKNKSADIAVEKFNAEHAGQERFINVNETGIVKGLNKYLSITGQMPSTASFKDITHIPIQQIIEAKYIVYGVGFDDNRLVMLPVFVRYNPPKIK